MSNHLAAPRYFPEVVEQIVDELFLRGSEESPGRVVILSGRAHSGRSTVLNQAVTDLKKSGIFVVRREVQNGSLQRSPDSRLDEHILQGAKILSEVLQIAGAGIAGNLVALAAEIGTARREVAAVDTNLSLDPFVAIQRVAEAIRLRAQGEPLALVVDDADKLDRPEVWWDALFGTTLPRLARRLPILVVLVVERTPGANSHALHAIDVNLLPGGLVEEIRFPTLDDERILRAIGPADDDLLFQLRSLVDGRPAWLDEIWREWRALGAVVQWDGRWSVAPDARDRVSAPLQSWVEASLRAITRGDEAYNRAKEIVKTAALEGLRFTAEALASVLGEDVEELIDWIDDHLVAADGESMLDDAGFIDRVEGVDPPALRCYRFRSAVVAGALRQQVLDEANGRELARQYARALAVAYQWSSVTSCAWTISRLAATAGDTEVIEYIWRRANRLEGVETAEAFARFLVEQLHDEATSEQELAAAIERLNDLNHRLIGNWNATETLNLCQHAKRIAQTMNQGPGGTVAVQRKGEALRYATHNLGLAALESGDVAEAVAQLRDSARMSENAPDHVRTAHAYRMLANAEFLGQLINPEWRSAAQSHIVVALEFARRDSSRAGLMAQVRCYLEVSNIALSPAERPHGKAALRNAVAILQSATLNDRLADHASVVADCLNAASMLAMLEGRLTTHAQFASAVTNCTREAGSLVIALVNLSDARQKTGDMSGAIRAACQAQRLAANYSREVEGLALAELANCGSSPISTSVIKLASLAQDRLSGSTQFSPQASQVQRDFGNILARISVGNRRDIEREYRLDKGMSILQEAFDVNVFEIDLLNESLGGATEQEMRRYLLDVLRYCAPG